MNDMWVVVSVMKISNPKYGTRTAQFVEFEGNRESCEEWLKANNDRFNGKLEIAWRCY